LLIIVRDNTRPIEATRHVAHRLSQDRETLYLCLWKWNYHNYFHYSFISIPIVWSNI